MRASIVAAIAAPALFLAACGGATPAAESTPSASPSASDPASSTATPAAFPVTIASGDGSELTLDAPPQRIVSISPTATEILFAVGAGDQVVAVDSLSNFPEEAPITDISAFEPNVEAISTYDPDLVIVGFDTNDIVAGLTALQIPTLVQPAAVTLDDVWQQLLDTGIATGHAEQAEQVVADLRGEIEDLVASVTVPDEPLTYYHELDDTFYSATSTTFIGSMYALFGLENIADAADPDGSAYGYPQLSAEYVVDADPDLVFLASGACCAQTAETVAARPGWSEITAVELGQVVLLPDDVVSRWGPRVVEFARIIATAVADAETTA